MWKWQLVLSALATFTTAFAAPMPSVTIDVQKVDETIEPVPRVARFDYEAGESDSSKNSSARPAAIEHMSSAADPVRPGVSVRTALVYDGALAPSIRTEHMLDFVIPADRLFKMN